MKKWLERSAVLSMLLATAACGGGGTVAFESADLSQSALFAAGQSGASRPVTIVRANKDGGSVRFEGATLSYSPMRISNSVLAGAVSPSSNTLFDFEVDLNAGGLAYLNGGAAGTKYVFVFTDGTVRGVGGQEATSRPNGTVKYEGNGVVIVNDPTGPATIEGGATINANFSSNQAKVTISQSGTGTATITDASISGTRFSGGSLTLTGGFSNAPSGVSVDHDGAFYGPGGQEVGGAFYYGTSGAEPITVLGTYSGKR